MNIFRRMFSPLIVAVATFALASCGGEGISSTPVPSVAVAPAPAPTPAPVPAPPPAPPPSSPPPTSKIATIFAEPLYNTDLAVVGKGWQFDYVPNGSAPPQNKRDSGPLNIRYDAPTKSYLVDIPLAGSGTLMQVEATGLSGDASTYGADPSNKAATTYCCATLSVMPADRPDSRYSYVSFLDLYASSAVGPALDTVAYGSFAVAQPTRAGDVPTTGKGRFTGDVFGTFTGDAYASWITGTAKLDFDFAAATLTGDLSMQIQCMMGCTYPGVVYSLSDTRFVRGGATFGGDLITGGAPARGNFSGLFAGPGAAELVAAFQTPFFNPEFQQWIDVRGVIAGKRNK